MSSPYGVCIRFLTEGTEDELFREIGGLESIPRMDDIIYLNDIGYKVESVKLYLYDTDFTNPQTGKEQWSIKQVLYKVYVSTI